MSKQDRCEPHTYWLEGTAHCACPCLIAELKKKFRSIPENIRQAAGTETETTSKATRNMVNNMANAIDQYITEILEELTP